MYSSHSPLFITNSYEKELEQYNVQDLKIKMNLIQSNWINNIEQIKQKSESELKSYFFEDIFIKILSYKPITSGEENWDINIESSTEVDSKRADAILGFYSNEATNNRTLAVVEVKGPEIILDAPQNRSKKNYGTPVEQAFQYSFKHDGCKWIIATNIYEIRLYQVGRSTIYYEEFHLEELAKNEQEFKRFHFLLSKTNLLGLKTKELSEKAYKKLEEITNEFYKLYSNTRIELWESLIKDNTTLSEDLLLEKAQKILDRVIFICFAQSKALLPTEILQSYIEEAEMVKNINIWNYLKELFRSIDIGNRNQNINQFNGELFKQDPVLDYLTVSDEIFKSIKLIANHDFNNDVNINILGHIFEQSISDIDELKNRSNINKRKRDGIFYTPEYITRYMVENTLLHWIDDKKIEQGYNTLKSWQDANSLKGRSRRVNANFDFWNSYSKVLDQIKILDPACGSGAFLNQTFEYLLKEKRFANTQLRNFKFLQEIEPSNYEDSVFFQQPQLLDLDKNILNENLYGVDFNRESVEITKLSLWLNTADPNKKLANLNNNIKYGNSLISDTETAGEAAFDWFMGFKEIMSEGGFDIIIGNPPYVLSRNQAFTKKEKVYFKNEYKLQLDKPNTYLLFIERALNLLKDGGYLGLILPNSWLGIDSATEIRKYLLETTTIKSIINLYGISFIDANVETVILIVQKKKVNGNKVSVSNIKAKTLQVSHSNFKEIPQKNWMNNKNYIFDLISDEEDNLIINKILKKSKKLDEVATTKTGLQAYEENKGNPIQSKDDVKNRIYDFNFKFDESTLPYLNGGDVGRYSINWSKGWLKYGECLSQPRSLTIFQGKRLLVREVVGVFPKSILGTYVEEVYLNNKSILNIIPKEDGYDLKYILAVINSKFISFYFKRKAVKANRTLFPKITKGDLADLPIPIASTKDQYIIGELVNVLLTLNEKFNIIYSTSLKILMTEYNLTSSNKIKKFYELSWEEFVAEIKKQNKTFSLLINGNELLNWFETQREEIMLLIEQQTSVENQINKWMYNLNNFTDKEIDIIESYNLG